MLRAARDRVLATLHAFESDAAAADADAGKSKGGGRAEPAAAAARERARVALLRGRALDAMEAFDPEAEAALTKAVGVGVFFCCRFFGTVWGGVGVVFLVGV